MGLTCNPQVEIEGYMEMTIRYLLWYTSWIFGGPDCNLSGAGPYYVYIKIAACWDYDNGTGYVVPCNSTCCDEFLKLLYDEDGCPYITAKEVVYTGECEPGPGETCDDVCDLLDDIPLETCLITDPKTCDQPCNNSIGTVSYTGSFNNPPYNDHVNIVEYYRGLCDGYYETEFYTVNYTNAEGTIDGEDALKRSVEITLWNLGAELGSIYGAGTYRIQIKTPSCWHDYTITGYPDDHVLLPCDFDCCQTTYEIHVEYSGGAWVVTQTTVTSHDPGNDIICYDDPCLVEACISTVYNTNAAPRKSMGENYTNESGKYNFYSYVIPNPATETTNIYVESSIRGNIAAEVIDIMGNSVIRLDINKEGYKAVFELNTNNMSSGIYKYWIIQNGINLGTGQFVVLH